MSFGSLAARAEAGLLWVYQRAGGPVSSGLQVSVGSRALQSRTRRLGGGASGGHGASRLHRVCRSDDLDVSSAQYFVNSSFAP